MNKVKIVIPSDLMNLFNKGEFTPEELFNLISESEETKKFLGELKPVIIEYLKKEFPAIGLLGIF